MTSATCRAAAALFSLSLGAVVPAAGAANPPEPIFVEDFVYGAAGGPQRLVERWVVSGGLQPDVQARRIVPIWDHDLGRMVARISVQKDDALSGARPDVAANLFVCHQDGSRMHEMEGRPGGIAPTERAEMQIRHNHETRAGELVQFGETTWYRFAFKIAGDWPNDRPADGRPACRTVIHQIKQDSFDGERSCNASPFFKIEARPLDGRALFFAQVTFGSPCTAPAAVRRVLFCVVEDLRRETWHRVNVRLFPSHADGHADVWLNGRHCGVYRGPMADAEFGAMRQGSPMINVQPRFGLYRDRRAETQTMYIDRIMFWSADPHGHPDWAAEPK